MRVWVNKLVTAFIVIYMLQLTSLQVPHLNTWQVITSYRVDPASYLSWLWPHRKMSECQTCPQLQEEKQLILVCEIFFKKEFGYKTNKKPNTQSANILNILLMHWFGIHANSQFSYIEKLISLFMNCAFSNIFKFVIIRFQQFQYLNS